MPNNDPAHVISVFIKNNRGALLSIHQNLQRMIEPNMFQVLKLVFMFLVFKHVPANIIGAGVSSTEKYPIFMEVTLWKKCEPRDESSG